MKMQAVGDILQTAKSRFQNLYDVFQQNPNACSRFSMPGSPLSRGGII